MNKMNQSKSMKTETERQKSELGGQESGHALRNTQHAARFNGSTIQRFNGPCPVCDPQSQPSTALPPHDSVSNTDGFWELAFSGQRAILPQHQGLFYVAFLLANPHAAPITAMDLAAEVFEQFGEHDDFRPPIPKGYRDGAQVAKILLRKEKRLEAIVDREDEEDVVRIEALRELIVLDEFKRIYFSQVAHDATNAGEAVSDTLRELHAMLATAVDTRGNPHRVIRDFAMHLLHYVLMPSDRVSQKERVELFVYRPA
jgi:hypothetical protein